jgi:hypothetical protein
MHPVKSIHVLAPVTALAAVLLPGCRERPDRLAWWEAEQERIELSQRLALVQYQQRNAPPDHTAQLRELQATTRNLAQRAFDLAQTRTTLSAEIQDLETQLDQLAGNALKDQRRQPGTGRGQSQLGRSGPHLAAALSHRGTHPIS